MEATVKRDMREYRPSENRAILVHKYYLGIELGYDPSVEEATESWERNHALNWRNAKMRRDVEAQIREIDSHRDQLSKERGSEIAWEHAAKEWVSTREAQWREQWESTVSAGA